MFKILVPMDGSNHALKALHIACDLAIKYQARIVLLHVLSPDKNASDILDLPISRKFSPLLFARLQLAFEKSSAPLEPALLQKVGHNILKVAAARVHRLGVESEHLPLAIGDPAENILSAYQLTSANTIVMGSRGLDPAQNPNNNSVSHTVFAKADCTCISVK
ncbi:MAG: universal stress protein [Hyphomicrobiaceae bacterium]|nr:universal stress protein [Hyphomicrobiaceae bacterium]